MATHSSILLGESRRGAWWAEVHGVAKSQTRLKLLSMHARKSVCVCVCVCVCVAVPTLSYGTQDLQCSLWHAGSLLWHVNLVAACGI